MKALKEGIVQWNRLEFGYVGCKKSQLLEALKLLNAKEGEFGLSDAESCERAVARSEVENLLFWKKSLGDRNQGCYGLRKEIIILNSFIRWLIPLEGLII